MVVGPETHRTFIKRPVPSRYIDGTLRLRTRARSPGADEISCDALEAQCAHTSDQQKNFLKLKQELEGARAALKPATN
jgi:hypothetical protein